MTPQEISNPRRILVIHPAIESGRGATLSFLKELTGTSLSDSASGSFDTSLAGKSHTWHVKTRYYTADLPVWVDEIGTETSEGEGASAGAAAWARDFQSAEADEVLRAIGAWVVCFRQPVDRHELEHVRSCIRAVADVSAAVDDSMQLVVGMAQSASPSLDVSSDDWDDWCRDVDPGIEYIDAEAKGKNEFGEVMGIERVKEALEANDWDAVEDLDVEGEVEDPETEELGLGQGVSLQEAREMMAKIFDAQDENGAEDKDGPVGDQVDDLEAMMKKILAVREAGSELPEPERRRLAARTVNEIMNAK